MRTLPICLKLLWSYEVLMGTEPSFHHVFVISVTTSFNLFFSEWKSLYLLCLKTQVAILWIQGALRILFVNVKFPVSFPLWCSSSVQQRAQCLRWPVLTRVTCVDSNKGWPDFEHPYEKLKESLRKKKCSRTTFRRILCTHQNENSLKSRELF